MYVTHRVSPGEDAQGNIVFPGEVPAAKEAFAKETSVFLLLWLIPRCARPC